MNSGREIPVPEGEKERVLRLLRDAFPPRTQYDKPFTHKMVAEWRSQGYTGVFPEDLPYRVGQVMEDLIVNPLGGGDFIQFMSVSGNGVDPYRYFSLKQVYARILNVVESLRKSDILQQDCYNEIVKWLDLNKEWDESQQDCPKSSKGPIVYLGTDEFSIVISSYLQSARKLEKLRNTRFKGQNDSKINTDICLLSFFTKRQAHAITKWLDIVRGWSQFQQYLTKIDVLIAYWHERSKNWAE
jgi:hypothetical protein